MTGDGTGESFGRECLVWSRGNDYQKMAGGSETRCDAGLDLLLKHWCVCAYTRGESE